jgi:hypothetical protein
LPLPALKFSLPGCSVRDGELPDGFSDPAPSCCAVGIALGRELVGARGGLLLGLIAIAPEHQGRGAPDIDFRYHWEKIIPDQRRD